MSYLVAGQESRVSARAVCIKDLVDVIISTRPVMRNSETIGLCGHLTERRVSAIR